MADRKKNQRDVLREEQNSMLKAILEFVKDVPQIKDDAQDLKDKADETNDRLEVVEGIIRSTSQHLKRHDREIARLKNK